MHCLPYERARASDESFHHIITSKFAKLRADDETREVRHIANENPDVTWRNDRRRRDEHQEKRKEYLEVVSSLPLRQKLGDRIVLLEGTTERKLIRLVS